MISMILGVSSTSRITEQETSSFFAFISLEGAVCSTLLSRAEYNNWSRVSAL